MMKARIYPRRGLHGEVVHTIAMRILRDELRPGDPLPSEEELSAELAASRTVMREAVKVLAAKGLVEARPKTGTRVRPRADWNLVDPDVLAWQLEAKPDGELFRNVTELRRIVEPQAAKLAAERASEAEIAALEEAFHEMEEALADPEAYLLPDLRFHDLILSACHNELLEQTAGTMRAVFRALFLEARTAETIERATELHGAIVKAIRARDGARAARAMTELIENTAAALRI
jgi:GntR family galactonate operon transcriptional repressor